MLRQDLTPRIFFDEPVDILVEGEESLLCGRALNISVGGMFVRAPVVLESETKIQVRFELPTTDLIVADATVLRTIEAEAVDEPPGMALRFDAMDDWCQAQINRFIDDRSRPGSGEAVRLKIADVGTPMKAKVQSSWDNIVSVDAELPFLRLGSSVHLEPSQSARPADGQIRWVAVHICPESGVPRLNIGIEVETPEVDPVEASLFDEVDDPILTSDFVSHSRCKDQEVRAVRRQARAKSADGAI